MVNNQKMKKLTAVFITLFFAYTALCQGHFRVQAGPVFNYLKDEGGAGDFSKLNTGFTLGVGYEMQAAKNFSIQPEFNFVHISAEEGVSSTDIKFDYLHIPVLLKGITNNRKVSVYLGPQLGFLMKSSAKNAGGGSQDIKDDLTQTEFAGVVGFEYVFPQNITLNARFIQGFSNVYKAEFDSPQTTRHQIFALTAGYIFKKKK
jgi:opacity protein-like surface antigen